MRRSANPISGLAEMRRGAHARLCGRATVLVGRGRELSRIDKLFSEHSASSAWFVEIAGEAGIGKTSLLSCMVERAERFGWAPAVGRASEFEREHPFVVFVDALEGLLADAPKGALDRLGADQLREIASAFPSLASSLTDTPDGFAPPGGTGADRYRLYRAVAGLLGTLARSRPLLLAIDDLHWADPGSLELLLHLLRRPLPGVAFAVTYRVGQLSRQVEAGFEVARREGSADRLELGPLSREEVDDLIPDGLPAPVVERIYADSGGNPYYLAELIRAARCADGRAPASVVATEPGVPETVAAAIATEIRNLAQPVRDMLEAAAVVGDPFEPDIAAQAAQLSQADAMRATDELFARDLIRTDTAVGRFRFRHPIVRRAVYDSARPGWLIEAHARVAEVLEARGAPAIEFASHIERAGRQGDEHAIAVLSDAGRAALARSPATAAEWLGAALRLLPARPQDRERRVELLVVMAIALVSAGKFRESRDAFQGILRHLPASSPLRARAVGAAALSEHFLGNHDEAQALIRAALSGVKENSAEAVELRLAAAASCFFVADWKGMREWSGKALSAPTELAAERAEAAAYHALAHYGLGFTRVAHASAQTASEIVDSLSDGELAPRLFALSFLAWAERCIERHPDAIRHAQRGLAICEATGQDYISVAMLIVMAMSMMAGGELQSSGEVIDTVVEASLVSENNLFLTWSLSNRCVADIELGNLASAIRVGEQARVAAVRGLSAWVSVAQLYLAEAQLESGHPQRCRGELIGVDGVPLRQPLPFYDVHTLEVLTRTDLALGEIDSASSWAEHAADIAQRLALDGPMAQALRAQAAVQLARGRASKAAEMALASAETAARSALRPQAAWSRLLAGRALARAGDQGRAIEQLRSVTSELAVGASRCRDQAARELRRIGVPAPGAPRTDRSATGLDMLSERARQIAQLVHEGHTNRRIANELSLSEKTIENHLSRIYTKLNLTSRAQLAALVERTRTDEISPFGAEPSPRR